MRLLLFSTLLCTSLAFAGDSRSTGSTVDQKHERELVTVEGCVSRLGGDYILFLQDPGETYELEALGKIKLGNYLGQWVEVTGRKLPSMSTSCDALTTGSASPLTIAANSIRTIAERCSAL